MQVCLLDKTVVSVRKRTLNSDIFLSITDSKSFDCICDIDTDFAQVEVDDKSMRGRVGIALKSARHAGDTGSAVVLTA